MEANIAHVIMCFSRFFYEVYMNEEENFGIMQNSFTSVIP